MRYYDISLNLSTDTVRWVVAPPLEVHERRRMSRGDDANASGLTVSVHAGTHVDAPFHFLPAGAGIDSLPLERFIGPALVHAVEADRYITEDHVKAIPLDGAARVLFKTRNSELLKQREYDSDFVAFFLEAARALVACGVELVGLAPAAASPPRDGYRFGGFQNWSTSRTTSNTVFCSLPPTFSTRRMYVGITAFCLSSNRKLPPGASKRTVRSAPRKRA